MAGCARVPRNPVDATRVLALVLFSTARGLSTPLALDLISQCAQEKADLDVRCPCGCRGPLASVYSPCPEIRDALLGLGANGNAFVLQPPGACGTDCVRGHAVWRSALEGRGHVSLTMQFRSHVRAGVLEVPAPCGCCDDAARKDVQALVLEQKMREREFKAALWPFLPSDLVGVTAGFAFYFPRSLRAGSPDI